jgi:glyoxylate/hydroxypyruvate reductase A
MRITFCCTHTKAEPWLAAFARRCLRPDISEWATGSAAGRLRSGVGATPAVLDEQPALKGIFNIGAGVDALLKLRLPAGATVVRLDDAGMSVQMAEFVCHAVIRHFREFDGYEADVAQGKWSFRKPRVARSFPSASWAWGCWASGWPVRWRSLNFRSMAGAAQPKAIDGVRCFTGHGSS